MQHLLNSDEFAFRYDCGFAQPTSTLALKDRERIVTTIAMHYSIVQCMAELAQLQDGLRSLNVLDMMQANPTVIRPLLIHSPQVLTLTTSMICCLPSCLLWDPTRGTKKKQHICIGLISCSLLKVFAKM